MCGIIGYIGKQNAVPILIDGLRRESYRGYDSSGLVVFQNDGKSCCIKAVGKLENLETKLENRIIEGEIGLGHTRWATHGGVTEEKAHPHSDCKGNIFLVHNGIIENYKILKEKLELKNKNSLQTAGNLFPLEGKVKILPRSNPAEAKSS